MILIIPFEYMFILLYEYIKDYMCKGQACCVVVPESWLHTPTVPSFVSLEWQAITDDVNKGQLEDITYQLRHLQYSYD